MGLGFPGLFTPRGELLANYNYQDIETGTGVVTFYGIKDVNDASHKLIEEPVDVGGDFLSFNDRDLVAATTTWDEDGAVTFDTEEFKTTKVVKGIAYAVFAVGGDSNDGVTIADLKLVHVYSGGTTNLTAEIDLVEATDGDPWNTTLFVKLGEISSTILSAGDKLRLSMTLTVNSGAYLYHNPSNSTVTIEGLTSTTTRMSVHIPFKLNI